MENVKRKPNWSEKEKLMLVKEVNDREGRLFGKFSEVGAKAKGTKLKETAWEEVASMINRFIFAHPNIYIEITPLKENKQNVSILSKRPCTDKYNVFNNIQPHTTCVRKFLQR